MVDLFKKTRYSSSQISSSKNTDLSMIVCTGCGRVLNRKLFEKENSICPSCAHYGRISSVDRILSVADKNTFKEYFQTIVGSNPLEFDGYDKKFKENQQKTGIYEAVVTGECKINGISVAIGAMDTEFLMASMSSAVGEKITKLFEFAIQHKLPVILFTASGGARMHEGIFSLMQMAKTSMIVKKHSEAGLLYISVITDPTTGGVSASFASLADILIGEKGATYAFAGRRVIEATVSEKLPDDFQSVENAMKNGFIDMVVERPQIKEKLKDILSIHCKGEVN